MTDLRLAVRQIGYEHRAFRRNPPAAFFTFVFPVVLLVAFSLVLGDGSVRLGARRAPAEVFFVPAILTFSVVTACFTNIAMSVALARDRGVLKRIRGTPLPAWAYLAGRVGHAVLLALVLVALVVAAGAIVHDLAVSPRALPALLLAVSVGAAAFCALGLAMSAAVPSAESAPALVNAVILPLFFISDVFVPLGPDAPPWVRVLGEVFPVKQLAAALQAPFSDGAAGVAEPLSLGVVAAWGVAGALVALRFFSWEPRR